MKSSFVCRATGIKEGEKEELGKKELGPLFPTSGTEGGGEEAMGVSIELKWIED